MLPVSWPTSLSAFVLEIPVLARLVEVAVPSNPRRTACAAVACPVTVLVVVVVVGAGNRPPSCARLAEGHANRPASIRATAADAEHRWFIRFISTSFFEYGSDRPLNALLNRRLPCKSSESCDQTN